MSDMVDPIDYTFDRLGRRTTINQGTNTTDCTCSLGGMLLTETGGPLDGVTLTNTLDSLPATHPSGVLVV